MLFLDRINILHDHLWEFLPLFSCNYVTIFIWTALSEGYISAFFGHLCLTLVFQKQMEAVIYFISLASKSLLTLTAVRKLQDTYSLEEKL